MTGRALCIGGATATGKTALAVALAQELDGELVIADSRQVIRGLRVGTCAPLPEELAGVPCHLLDLHAPGEPFSVARWVTLARAALEAIDARNRLPIVVGGTGLYISALVDGFDVGGLPPEPSRRAELDAIAETPGGRARLVQELLARDPAAGTHVALDNHRRVIRALEMVESTGQPVAAWRRRAEPGVAALVVAVDLPRPLHRQVIGERSAAMFVTDRLLDEVRGALRSGVAELALARCGIGYTEALAVLAGTSDVTAAIGSTTARTLRYAKAQRTWFRPRAEVTVPGPAADGLRASVAATRDAWTRAVDS